MASDSEEVPQRQEITVRVVKSGRHIFSENPVDRYQHHFIHLIGRHLEVRDGPMLALDLACGVGLSTLALFERLPPGSRVVAISDDRVDLKRFHEQLTSDQRKTIFPRKEKRDRLPFAVNLFDVVWAALPSEPLRPLRPILRQALRVLRPGGQLIITAPLRRTFLGLANAIGPSLEGHKDDAAFQALLSEPPELISSDDWIANIQRCGAIEAEIHHNSVEINTALPLSSQPLFSGFLLPLWLGDDLTLQAQALRLLDVAVKKPLVVTIHIGCVTARRGLSEIEDETSG